MARAKHRTDPAHPAPVPHAEAPDDFADAPGGDIGDSDPSADDGSGPGAKVTRTRPEADAARSDEKPPPPFGTAKPAGAGALPRVVPELARAGEGETRYKIACRNYSPQKTRYVLAEAGDEDGAVKCYLAANGLDKVLAKLRGRAKNRDDVEAPELVVTELPD